MSFLTRTLKHILNQSSHSSVQWARWCLPSINANCDQQLKGHLADADNSCCDSLMMEYQEEKKKSSQTYNICAWSNPTALLVLSESFGR